MPDRCRFRVFFSYLNFTLLTVDNIHHSRNVSSNRNETLTVTCSHSAQAVEFRYGLKLLGSAFRFQTLTVIALYRFYIFSWRYRVNAITKRKNFGFRFQTLQVSYERGHSIGVFLNWIYFI